MSPWKACRCCDVSGGSWAIRGTFVAPLVAPAAPQPAVSSDSPTATRCHKNVTRMSQGLQATILAFRWRRRVGKGAASMRGHPGAAAGPPDRPKVDERANLRDKGSAGSHGFPVGSAPKSGLLWAREAIWRHSEPAGPSQARDSQTNPGGGRWPPFRPWNRWRRAYR